MRLVIAALLALPLLFTGASAHTIDAVGEYRLEIGWMNEPVVSGETNGIELHVSTLVPCPQIPHAMECASSQEFSGGVAGLEKKIKMQLVYMDKKITLPFVADHNIDGKYYSFVNPTVSGFYQANLLGTIGNETLSLSMHPPKVSERAYIEFPEPASLTVEQIIEGHTALIEEIGVIKSEMKAQSGMYQIGYAGIGLGIAGIAIAAVALARPRR